MAPIPHFQPLPFPAPLWFLKTCLVIGFYLHALPMNVALIGGLISAGFIAYGRLKSHAYAQRLGKALASSLPYFVSAAITQGIVPLLFLQLVYGPLFYTSSILIAVPWILVIFILLTAYYTYYYYTYHRQDLGARSILILTGAGVLFLTIAFIFSNNMTLMLAPERWVSMYQQNPHGLHLNIGDPQLLPRYLHFVTAAVAVTGMTIGCFGLYWYPREKDYGAWLIRTGAAIYTLVTLLQIPIGIWFLFSLRHAFMMNYLGADPMGTRLFMTALGLDLIGLIAMIIAWRHPRPRPFQIGLVSGLIVIFLMVIMRHLLRVYSTQAFFTPSQVPVNPQWVLLGLFLVSFVVGTGYMAWLLRIAAGAFQSSPVEQGSVE